MPTANSSGSGLRGMLARVDASVSMAAVLSFHWCLFWLLNGFDKFFNSTDFFGANFEGMLEGELLGRLNLDASLAQPIAVVVGIIELVLGVLFLAALAGVLGRRAGSGRALSGCITLSVLFFALLTAGSILFGARDQMLQQGVFIAALLGSRLVVGSGDSA